MPNDAKQPQSSSIADILKAQAETGLEPHEIERLRKIELLRKVRVVRESLLTRNSQLAGTNPAKTYQWVNYREERQTYFQAIGWTLCTDPKVESPFKDKATHIHRRADVILYEIDKDYYEAIVADNQIRGLEGIEGARDSFRDFAHSKNVPTHIPQQQR